MKRVLFFFIAVFILSISTHGQNTYTGTIFHKGTPSFSLDFPPVPCPILWLETASDNYILNIDSHWIFCEDKLIVDGIEYGMDDEVEITGTVKSVGIDIYSEEHFELEIETIRKKGTNIETVSFSNNKVCYDAEKQVIVIDETLQNQSFTLELVNMQGKVILKKTNIGNSSSISIANLLGGVYLYRLTQNGKIICTGKILKND